MQPPGVEKVWQESYPRAQVLRPRLEKQTAFARASTIERLNPSLQNPDYLVLIKRRRLLAAWIETLPREPLRVLDIRGRIQPYRPLLQGRLGAYFAVDPLATELVDVVAIGERLPFVDESFDLVICTQVLCYCEDPWQIVSEIRRVLRPGGRLLLSTPAIFPRHAQNDCWRFLPSGLRLLLREFSEMEIAPEGFSVASICRFVAVGLDLYSADGWRHRFVSSLLIPLVNRIGRRFDKLSRADTGFTTNCSVFARK